jgi:hypothetical protein
MNHFLFYFTGKADEVEEAPLPNLHLSFSDLFTTEQTSVMQLEHCSSIGNTINMELIVFSEVLQALSCSSYRYHNSSAQNRHEA